MGVADGYAVARLRPQPHLVSLPPDPPDGARSPGPVPAPTGDGRYFAYRFPSVYDACDERWIRTATVPTDINALPDDFPFLWGETHEELYEATNFWDGLLFGWVLLQPKMELPPFGDSMNFRVAHTASCLRLRKSGNVLGCLPDGTRVSLLREGVPPLQLLDVYDAEVSTSWVFVRTEDGLEGWVASDYLEHD